MDEARVAQAASDTSAATVVRSQENDAVFVAAVTALLKREGGFQNQHNDRGNWTSGVIGIGLLKGTKYGISAARYPELDIETLTEAAAAVIYRRDWWDRLRLDRLEPVLAAKMLDACVVDGPSSAIRCLQRACRACGSPLTEDGELGPITAATANRLGAKILMPALRESLAGYFRLVAKANPIDEPELAGWLKRAYDEAA